MILLFMGCKHEIKVENKEANKYLNMVGDIIYNPELDPSVSSFMPCLENYSYQYYNFESNGLQYKGEKPQLIKEIMESYSAPKDSSENGLVTIRFVVNCKGESGYYRIKQLDFNYVEKQFSEELISSLSAAVYHLKGWKTKSGKYGEMDYHQYLTFNIKDSQIKSIVP